VSARPSQLRGELKSKVQNAVVGHYGLHGLSRSRVEMKIATLLCDHAYVFRNPEKVKLLPFAWHSKSNCILARRFLSTSDHFRDFRCSVVEKERRGNQ
jgi:hypothetical protein